MTNPVIGGIVGRTDQGVDISASPGSTVIDPIPGVSELVGRIGNWFKGQPYEWFKVLSGPFKGQDWYGAEQIDFSVTQPGQRVSGGQQIGRIAASGTGTEFGFATPSGQTEAMATTGYREGQVTRAGVRFRQQVLQGKPQGIVRPGGPPPSGSGGGGTIEEVLAAYDDEVSAPRTAPKDELAQTPQGGNRALSPFYWWWQSFSGKWAADMAGGGVGAAGGAAATATPSGSVPADSHGLVTTALLQQYGHSRGWSGQQITDWMKVVKAESNGTLTDTNPSSGAYGIAQGITGPSWYYKYGGNPNTLQGQITAMGNYIAQRYGTPSKAWAHEQSMHWY